MEFEGLLTQWMSLVGIAALIAVVINLLKQAGVVKDGQAQTWSAGLNLVVLILLFLFNIFKPDIDIGEVDKQAAALAEVAVVVIGYVAQLLAAKATHAAVKHVPLIGTSYSGATGVSDPYSFRKSY